MVNRSLSVLTVVLGLSSLAPQAGAQSIGAGFNDPFFQYYGFYLPRQAALAAQPTTPQMLNNVAVARQEVIQQDRSGLYDPISSPFAPGPYNPSDPFSSSRREPIPRLSAAHIGGRSASTPAPTSAFNKTAQYYPTFRSSSAPNQNMARSNSSGSRGATSFSGPAIPGGGFSPGFP